MLPLLIAILGPPGCGKTSLVNSLNTAYPNHYIAIDHDEILHNLKNNEYFPCETGMLMPFIKKAQQTGQTILISHTRLKVEELSQYAIVRAVLVFTPLEANIIREIKRDSPTIIPFSVLNHYRDFYTGNPTIGAGPILETLTHASLEKTFSHFKIEFTDELVLYNTVGNLLTELNVKHDESKVNIRVRRGALRCQYFVLNAKEMSERVHLTHDQIEEIKESIIAMDGVFAGKKRSNLQ